MNKTAIVGIGSSFADDQAGCLVALQLLEYSECQVKISMGELIIEVADRPGVNLLQWIIREYSQLFLIDMVKTNKAEAGKIYMLNGREIAGFSGMLSSHSLGVASAVELAAVLGMDISKITFWGIEGICSTPGCAITKVIEAAVQTTALQILTRLGL